MGSNCAAASRDICGELGFTVRGGAGRIAPVLRLGRHLLVLHPEIANQLRDRKLGHLQAGAPEMIVSANIGCITHLQCGSAVR